MSMLSRDAAALVVIDFQERLLPKIPVAGAVMDQAVKLIRFARELSISILCTEQYPKGLGPTAPKIADELAGIEPIAKMSFGCMGEPVFAEALKASGRTQVLLTGVETHVCVMQTALQAREAGFEVFVPRDAVGSRDKAEYKAGLARMARGGVEIVTTEMAMFETLGQAGTPEFKRVLPLIK